MLTPQDIAFCQQALTSVTNCYGRLVARSSDGYVVNSGTATFLKVDGRCILATARHVATTLPTTGSVSLQLFSDSLPKPSSLLRLPIEIPLDFTNLLPLSQGTKLDVAAILPPAELLASSLPRWLLAENHVGALPRLRQDPSPEEAPIAFLLGFPRFARFDVPEAHTQVAGVIPLQGYLLRFEEPPAILGQPARVVIVAEIPEIADDMPELGRRCYQYLLDHLEDDPGPIGGFSGGPLLTVTDTGAVLVGILTDGRLGLANRCIGAPLDMIVSQIRQVMLNQP